jgi:hypothetical protein
MRPHTCTDTIAGWTTRSGGTRAAKAACLGEESGDRADHRLALAWNATKDLRFGGKDLLLTPAGLWVASDTEAIGGETHERLALMPT